MPLRVVLADDHYLVREGLRRLLETQPDIEVVAACDDLESPLAAVSSSARTSSSPTSGCLRRASTRASGRPTLRETHPEIGVVVLRQYAEPRYALPLLEDGPSRRAYLFKERVDDVEQLVRAIRAVAEGGSVSIRRSSRRSSPRTRVSRARRSTPDAARAGRAARDGRGQEQRCYRWTLFLTERSVENVIHSVFLKLGIGWEPSVTSV